MEQRRQKLRELVDMDHEQLKPRSKLEEMREKVARLKEDKETERQKIAESKKREHFRINCDEIRNLESKMLSKQLISDWANQLDQLARMEQRRVEEKKYWDEQWELDRLQKVKREEKESHDRTVRLREVVRVLDEQVAYLAMKRKQEQLLKQEEISIFLRQLEEQKLRLELAERQRKEKQMKVREELDRFNSEKMKRRVLEVQETLAFELDLLDRLAREDDKKQEMEREKKEKFKQDLLEFRNHLLKQREEERKREMEMEKLIYEDMKATWDLQQAKWDQEQKYRDKLMQEVLEGRRLHHLQKLEKIRKEQEQLKMEQQAVEERIKMDKKNYEQSVEKKKEGLERYRLELAEQVETLNRMRREEEERVQAEIDAIKKEQDKYTQLLKAELENFKAVPRSFGMKRSDFN